jgi:iron(III) transport system permease protein
MKSTPRSPLAIWLVAVSAVIISLVPLSYLLVRVFGVGLEKLISISLEPRTHELIFQSIALAISVSVSAVILGTFQAWIAIRSNLLGRKIFAVLAALPLAIPSYVAAYAWVALIPGFNGFFAAWLLLTVGTTPLTYLAVSAALVRFDSSTEEVARSLGSNNFQVFRKITWPNIRPAAVSGGLLSALYVLSDFGAVSIVRYDTFTRAIYNAYRASFDRNLAASLALLLVILTVLVLVFESRFRGNLKPSSVIASRVNRIRLGKFSWPIFSSLVLIASVSLAVPLGSMIIWSARGFQVIDPERLVAALFNSISLAVSGGMLTALFAVGLALLVVKFRSYLSLLLERSVWLTHATPGIVVALSLVFFANQLAPFIYQTTALVLIAYVALYLPNALAAISTPLKQSPASLDEVSASLGLSKLQTLRKVVLPIAGPGIFAGTTLVILTVLKELPATLLLRPTGVETLATRLWTETSVSAFSNAAPYALFLVVLAGFPAWLLNRAIRKDLEPISDLERVQ